MFSGLCVPQTCCDSVCGDKRFLAVSLSASLFHIIAVRIAQPDQIAATAGQKERTRRFFRISVRRFLFPMQGSDNPFPYQIKEHSFTQLAFSVGLQHGEAIADLVKETSRDCSSVYFTAGTGVCVRRKRPVRPVSENDLVISRKEQYASCPCKAQQNSTFHAGKEPPALYIVKYCQAVLRLFQNQGKADDSAVRIQYSVRVIKCSEDRHFGDLESLIIPLIFIPFADFGNTCQIHHCSQILFISFISLRNYLCDAISGILSVHAYVDA